MPSPSSIGLGRFGSSVAEELVRPRLRGARDRRPTPRWSSSYADDLTHVVRGGHHRPRSRSRQLGVGDFGHAVVGHRQRPRGQRPHDRGARRHRRPEHLGQGGDRAAPAHPRAGRRRPRRVSRSTTWGVAVAHLVGGRDPRLVPARRGLRHGRDRECPPTLVGRSLGRVRRAASTASPSSASSPRARASPTAVTGHRPGPGGVGPRGRSQRPDQGFRPPGLIPQGSRSEVPIPH